MKDQHKLIKGYRDLSQEEIDSMNKVKQLAATVGELINEIKGINSIDERWLNIGTDHLQQGFMAVVRSIAKPESF